MRTDGSKQIYFEIFSELSASGSGSARNYYFQPLIAFTPVNVLKLSASVNYSANRNNLQYVDTKTVGSELRYILGKIDHHTLGITFRADYNITPELSIQYYGSPFTTSGKFSQFKKVTDPNASKYNDRFSVLTPTLNGNTYEVSENNNSVIDYNFWNPNFDFSQFRSNLVLRWEYRPGSQFYFVWSQDRTVFEQPGSQILNDGMNNLTNKYPNNIFLIKFNYWFSI
jgi:hypothetical protein